MGTIATDSGGTYQLPRTGVQIARVVRVVDLGHQETSYRGEIKPPQHKIMVIFELPDDLIEIEKGEMAPMFISKEYTLSLSEKANLRHDLEGWRGQPFTDEELKGFDVANILGKPCQLSILHDTNSKGKQYAKISGIFGLTVRNGITVQTVPDAYHTPFKYDIEEGLKSEKLEFLPEWVVKKIKAAKEFSEPAPTQVGEWTPPERPSAQTPEQLATEAGKAPSPPLPF